MVGKLESKRILLVDDDETVLKTISSMLSLEGYGVDSAKSGVEAIEKSNLNFYNLALIDIRLPDMEGTELLTAMRDTTPRMVKIILTGYPALQNSIKAVNNGADGYLTKPVNMDELLEAIRRHLEKQSGESRFDERKVSLFVETRFRELENEDREKYQGLG